MRTPAALAAVAALSLSGCGGSDPPSDQEQVRAALEDYVVAVKGDDPAGVCDVLVTPAQLAGSAAARERDRQRCRDRVGGGRLSAGQSLGELDVRGVRVRGRRAVVRTSTGERIELRRVDGHWRIVAPG